MANLAIKGHATRGKEVIEILEMLGGKMRRNGSLAGSEWTCGYYIAEDGHIDWKHYSLFNDSIIFTLEEFLEKFPYKVGDKVSVYGYETKVCIEEMKWDGFEIQYLVFTDETECYSAEELNKYNADFLMDKENGETLDNIALMHSDKEVEKKSLLTSLIEYFKTTPKDVLEREWNEHKELDEIGPTVEEYMKDNNTGSTMRVLPLKSEHCSWERILYPIPDGYEFSKIENNEIVIQKKQSKYPKNYEECCKVLGYEQLIIPKNILAYNNTSLSFFHKLIFCRNTYWEIAGKEMGLGKTWKPKSDNEELYYIQNYNKQIIKGLTNTTFNKILFFPTEEMRDVFYENFKDLIEACKELL